jgi:hypothetical protein
LYFPALQPRGSLLPSNHPLALLLLTLLTPASPAQAQSTDPAALVRRAIQNREDAESHRPLRYLLRKTDDHRDTTKDIIETDQGDVARLIAIHNQPLTPEANQAELDRREQFAMGVDRSDRPFRGFLSRKPLLANLDHLPILRTALNNLADHPEIEERRPVLARTGEGNCREVATERSFCSSQWL